MTLGTRARLAWIPLALWCAAGLWIAYAQAMRWKGDDVQDQAVLALGGLFLFAAGGWTLLRLRKRAAERARLEGPDVDVPVTWHRRSGSWAVIVFAAGVFGILGLVWLMGRQLG